MDNTLCTTVAVLFTVLRYISPSTKHISFVGEILKKTLSINGGCHREEEKEG